MRRLVFATLVLLAALTAAGGAQAAGGTSIANAPTITAGAKVEGNTASDSTSPGEDGVGVSSGCWHDLEYWKLPLTAGDVATVSGGEVDPANGFELGVFPAGTTDKTLATATAVKNGFPRKKSVEFSADSSGTYVLVIGPTCYNGIDGPFSFTVAVRHGAATVKVAVALAAPARITATGTVTATVKSPTGAPISDPKFALKLYGTWKRGATVRPHLLATASPADGSVKFSVHLPASLHGSTVQFQVIGGGPGYDPVKSSVITSKIT